MASKVVSYKELSARNDLADFEWDDEDGNQKPKKNPFDFGDNDAAFDTTTLGLVSQSEIKDFLSTSRGITYNNGDHDDPLGEPWGGAQYSLQNEKSIEAAKSARFHSGSFDSSQQSSPSSTPSSLQSQRLSGTSPKVPPARPTSTPSQPQQTNKKTVSNSPLTTKSTSSSHSNVSVNAGVVARDKNKTPSKSASSINAGVVREKTGGAKGPSSKKDTLKAASLSIAEAVESVPQVSVNDYNRLQKELAQLRRDLQASKQSHSKPLPVQESVMRIMRGQSYSLELHKSLQDKVNLLNHALKMHDGNAIIAVILFLKRTVKSGIFVKELCKRPNAVDHYCKYLQQHYDFNELAQLYRILGRYEDAAMVKFKQAINVSDPSLRLSSLKDVHRHDIAPYSSISPEIASTVQDYMKLLEMQVSVEVSDSRAELEKRNIVMNVHPRKASIPLQSTITTLFYCCMYHYGELESVQSSPLYLRNTFKIPEKQYEWTALSACAKIRKWKEIDEVLKGKGWFGGSKHRSLIGFEKVSILLFQSRAPEEVLGKYLRLVDDPSKRLSLATKCKSHEVAIETLVAMKDRQQLTQYRERLPNHAPQQQTIANYLRNSQIRWKN